MVFLGEQIRESSACRRHTCSSADSSSSVGVVERLSVVGVEEAGCVKLLIQYVFGYN